MAFHQEPILIALAVAFTLAPTASAQPTKGISACATVTATNCTGPSGMKTCTFRRNIGSAGTMAPSCVTAVELNANCSVMSSMYVLTFNAAQTGASPSCQWSCTSCPTVTLDTSAGLPVELLGFDVEYETTREAEPEESQAEKSELDRRPGS